MRKYEAIVTNRLTVFVLGVALLDAGNPLKLVRYQERPDFSTKYGSDS